MGNPDRLSGLDASFLSLENAGAHMHVGSVLVFEGEAPPYHELAAMIESRLHQVPRYRQKLAFPPLAQARPVWVDDPHFNVGYHVRHTALPAPAGEVELRRLAGRVFSQRLDRSKPLWEIWLVDRVGEDRFALVCKTHHALVDGISGVDIMTVLFDLEADPPEREPGPGWYPRPEPSGAALLADALAERAAAPLDAMRAAAGAIADPGRAGGQIGRMVAGLASMAGAGLGGAPPSPLNVRIGPHRRFAWAEADLGRFKAVKDALGGTVNDVVLAVVAGALRAHLIRRGREPEGLELKAMVPVSVRAEDQRGTLGNRVAAVYAPLPVGLADPLERFRAVHEALGDLKGSAQAVGAETLTQMAGFAAPTLLDQGARLQALQRLFNVTVTNVPGPQFPLFMLGRRLRAFYPEVPLVLNTALGIAIMSYDGMIFFGLLGDFEAMADIDDLAADLQSSIDELSGAAGVPAPGTRRSGRAPRPAADEEQEPGLRQAALAIVVAAVALLGLVLVLGARDDAEVAPAQGPGELRPDRGAAHDGPATATGDEPPTSGPHRPDLVTRDRRPLTDDQLIHALELGNVVILAERIDPELVAVQRAVAGPFDAEVAAAGQAVILARHDGPTRALAWRRLLRTDDPAELEAFAEAWLGRGVRD